MSLDSVRSSATLRGMETVAHVDSPQANGDAHAHSSNEATPADAGHVVIITPVYDLESHETQITIRGLREGAHIVVNVHGVDDERFLLIGKSGKLHAFGFGKNSGTGPIRIGGH